MMKQKPESLQMLTSCRDLAADLLSKSLTTMLDKIEESLFELADKALERDSYNLYMEARGQAQSKRSEIETEFRRRFVEGFNRTLHGAKEEGGSFDTLDFDSLELSLVGHDDYEEDLAVTNIATKLKSKLGDELNALDFRMGHLMQLPESSRDDHPMSPQAVVEAFRSACMKIESDLNVRLLVLKQFELLAAENVPNVYQNLNRFLVDRNILPTLPKSGFRRRNPGAPRGNGAGQQAQPGAGANPADMGMGAMPPGGYAAQMGFGAGGFAQAQGAGVDLPSYAVGNEHELISTLQQLLAFNQSMQALPAMAAAGMPQLPGAEHGQLMPAASPMPMFLGSVGQSFLDALNLLQQGRVEGTLADPGDLDADALNTGSANVLHQIKTTSLAASLGHVDAMTIDIVAMLFDNLFDDRNIPAPMKALIGRLQIPVLKVAMLDTKFFVRKQHPTRKLLDSLAQAAIGWDEADGLEDRLYKKIAEIVENIVANFDENIPLFEQASQELETFLAEEEQRAHSSAELATEQMIAAERAELASRQAEHVVAQKLAGAGELPELISHFVSVHWREVLKHAALSNETHPEAWPDAVTAVDDLLWSITPKVGVEERLRLVNLLPKLLRRLERGTEEAGIERASREAFFAELVHCHANAIKSGLKQAEPVAMAGVPPMMAATTAPSAAAPAQPLQFTPTTPAAPSSVAAPVATGLADLPKLDIGPGEVGFEITDANWDAGLDKYRDYDDVVANQLKRGAWVEFRQDDGSLSRAKLAWVSPRKSRYLFTNRQGENGLEFTLLELIGLFKRGDASLIESGQSVERAVSDMIDMLQTQAA
ncbi:DUF1631 domain-containing protein [Chitinimonas arctica]|uniref:DUF1631 domain-containing protein n=1 Tax=Chitinimonas arctica TaxID=2594795 RepID=A0A516SL05_9NEIS|nr:DUF1631 domain-containing protein [Chitinimonas arctica]QDQ28834.1 DUF1631 domain-containing protein [Chitinimonas arctica]